MKRKFTSIRILLFAALLLCSCSVINSSFSNNKLNIKNIEAQALEKPVYGEINTTATQVANGANAFAFKLSTEMIKQTGDENFVCSPFSVWLSLAALVNGTDDAHKPELLASLELAGLNESDINGAASRMLYDLTREQDRESTEQYDNSYHNPLQFANAIFVNNDCELQESFAQVFMDYYRGQAINVDFTSAETVDLVNQWASEHTDGLINSIVEDFDPETVAAITSAIYFSDRWSREFKSEQTVEDIFYTPSKETTAHFMLRQGDELNYYEDERIQAMPLSFLTGGGLLIMLPKDSNAKGLLADTTPDYFNKVLSEAVPTTGKLLLPRFSIESDSIALKNMLAALGVPLFVPEEASLTGGIVEDSVPVYLSDVLHKATIMVDEKGTTAAAVTVDLLLAASEPLPTVPFEMFCNTPFVFVLYNYTYDGGAQVLFTGVVNQP